MRSAIFLLTLLTSAAAQVPFHPTTTLAAETGNNSSASLSVSTYTSGHATSGNVSKVPIRTLLYAGANTKVFAALMGWFGKSGHIAVGYNSQSASQVQKQVEDMQSRGIDGAILAWYGKNSYENKTALALKAQAETHAGFQFAIMIDHGTLQWDSLGLAATDALIAQMNYIADTYYGSPAYLRVNGQPVIIEFALESYPIDWVRVGNSVKGNPLIIFRNPNGWTKTLSGGAYSWEPEKSDLSYLDYFYQQAAKYPGMQTMGSLSPGFNDSLATWTANRYADPQCGQLWLRKAAETNKFWSANKQLPFIQIATWNDYEEGSTIESGIDNCIGVSATVNGSILNWDLTGIGSENTIDHFTVFVSKDGTTLMPVNDVSTNQRQLDLAALNLEAATYQTFVKAIGRPSLLNHISNAATFVNVLVAPGSSSPADYSVVGPTAPLSMTPAQPASVTLNTSAANGFAGTITFTCSNLPSWAQCSFTPATVAAGSPATLVVRAVQSASIGSSSTIAALLLLLLVTGMGLSPTNRRRVSAIVAIGIFSASLVACGGGAQQASSAPQTQTAQTSTARIVVTATASDLSIAPKTIPVDIVLTK